MNDLYNQDPPRCIFCDKPGAEHHVQIKGMGGSRDPAVLEDVVVLCYDCHIPLLHDRPYTLTKTVKESRRGQFTIYEMVNPEGKPVAGRMFLEGFNESAFRHQVNVLVGDIERNADAVYLLSHEGLEDVAEAVKALGKQAWAWQGYLLHAAVTRSVYGTKMEKIAAACERFGFQKSTAYDLMQLVESFPDISTRLEVSRLPKSMFVLAAKAPDPEAALELAEGRKAEDPRYSVRDFREDLGKPEATCYWWSEEEQRCLKYEREEGSHAR